MRWRLAVALGVLATVVAPMEVLEPDNLSEMPVARVLRQITFPGQNPPQGNRPQGGGGGGGGCANCSPAVFCAARLDSIQSGCQLPTGEPGVCCPPSSQSARPFQGTEGVKKPFPANRINIPVGNLDPNRVNAACQKGIDNFNAKGTLEQTLLRNNMVLPRHTPASGHQKVFKVNSRAKRMDRDAQVIVASSRNMVTDFQLSRQEGGHGLRNVQVASTMLSDRCPPNPRCNFNSKYRTADGSCNNQKNPTWGQSNTPTQRILPPTYDDGVSTPRSRSVEGTPLPNPRQVVNNILVDVDSPDPVLTSSVMQWAQFMDHDFAHVPFPSLPNGEGIDCCPGGQVATGPLTHPSCFPIDTTNDPFYQRRNSSCMNFVRSMVAVGAGPECTFGYAEQLNQLTHWIDGSNVYGSLDEETRQVRSFQGGQLRTSNNNLPPIIPRSEPQGDCEAEIRNALCYLAGDSRINEQPGLTAIHTVWLRQHNLVARELQAINRQWSDEALFQEARRIIIAQIQHITYNEWLPIVVGQNFIDSFGIGVLQSGQSFDYNPNFNPNMNNEFATAAFRFGHSLVQGTLRLFSQSSGVSTIQLRNHFNSPHLIQNDGRLDDIIRSFTQLAIQSFDSFVTQDLSNHLFQTPRFNFGMDLMSINIHRGRDHGIATYNDIRVVCGLPKARAFSDFSDQIPGNIINSLSQVYASPDDVDFFVGGMSERPVVGGLLGWTFLCVVGDQFARLKKGDRFFYDLGGQIGSFSEPQLDELRKTSWARVLCDTSKIGAVQPLAFRQTGNRYNQPTNCQSGAIPRPNLQLWRSEIPQA